MKWTRTEYIDLMTYRRPMKPMFSELFGPIVGLPDEWKAQGATPDELDLTKFSFDYVPFRGIGNTGPINQSPIKVLQDTELYYEAYDGYGRHVKMDKRTATIPLPDTFPVQTMEDWLIYKSRFLFDESRISKEDLLQAKKLQEEGTLIVTSMPGGWDILRELMGEVNACIAFYETPELIQDILSTIGTMCTQVYTRILEILVPDQLTVHEDLAGKSGPLIGPNLVLQFLKPYYRRCWDLLHSHGTPLFCQDSDGNMNPVMDAFIECGVNVFYPCEPAAGMDIVALRKKYGHQIAFRGGIDKHVLRGTKEDILKELEYKICPCIKEGGIVLGLDHRITNGTPLENYIFYVKKARELLGLAPYEECEPGFGRMAF